MWKVQRVRVESALFLLLSHSLYAIRFPFRLKVSKGCLCLSGRTATESFPVMFGISSRHMETRFFFKKDPETRNLNVTRFLMQGSEMISTDKTGLQMEIG